MVAWRDAVQTFANQVARDVYIRARVVNELGGANFVAANFAGYVVCIGGALE